MPRRECQVRAVQNLLLCPRNSPPELPFYCVPGNLRNLLLCPRKSFPEIFYCVPGNLPPEIFVSPEIFPEIFRNLLLCPRKSPEIFPEIFRNLLLCPRKSPGNRLPGNRPEISRKSPEIFGNLTGGVGRPTAYGSRLTATVYGLRLTVYGSRAADAGFV
jgi:hypothetical protein